jgi:fructokinase
MKPLWGIDLGGTKTEGVVFDQDTEKVLCRKRVPTEREKGYKHILEKIALLVKSLSKETGLYPERIGIGTPGTLDPVSNTLKNSNTTCLIGKPLKQDIEKLLTVNIKIANDANCFALAETHLGAVRKFQPDAETVFGIILGTGVGGGVIVNGNVISGKQGIAGEWGHNFLDDSGGACYCGKTGCVETILSGPALEKYYYRISGKLKTLKQISDISGKNTDKAAEQTIQRLCHFFGKAIAVVINILDPDIIVVGGGLGNIEALYRKGVSEIEKYVFNNRMETPVIRPVLGDSAGVFGAAMLVRN